MKFCLAASTFPRFEVGLSGLVFLVDLSEKIVNRVGFGDSGFGRDARGRFCAGLHRRRRRRNGRGGLSLLAG